MKKTIKQEDKKKIQKSTAKLKHINWNYINTYDDLANNLASSVYSLEDKTLKEDLTHQFNAMFSSFGFNPHYFSVVLKNFSAEVDILYKNSF